MSKGFKGDIFLAKLAKAQRQPFDRLRINKFYHGVCFANEPLYSLCSPCGYGFTENTEIEENLTTKFALQTNLRVPCAAPCGYGSTKDAEKENLPRTTRNTRKGI